MVEYPVLNNDQLKRFRDLLVSSRLCSSLTQARKFTSNPRDCKDTFLKHIYTFDDASSISDICELYALDDEPSVSSGSVVPDSKAVRIGRGKASRPPKKVTSVAFDPDVYQELERLAVSEERTVGALVRLAVNYFLDARKKTD